MPRCPLSISHLAALVSLLYSVLNWIDSLRPSSCAVSYMVTASASAPAIGFSQYTCLPAFSAATVIGM